MPNQLHEGLRPLDLKEMINTTFSIDTFKSKMGEDKDVVVLSLTVKDRYPAKDIMEFIEKGYSFVLDADVSAGENNDGEYHVFVEMSRNPSLVENIEDLIYGIKKLTGLEDFNFTYHKKHGVHSLSSESIKSVIPMTPEAYENYLNETKTESVKKFFNKTLMDDLTVERDIITIHKPFNQQIKLRWLNESDPQAVVEGAPSLDPESTAETFWLTKVLGDYDIAKFGDRLLFSNSDQSMLLQRIK